jgi:hypothetical protein
MNDSMLIDQVMPTYDASRVEHRTIGGTPERLHRVVLDTDFLDAVSSSPMVRALFGLRALIERIVALVRRPPYEPPQPPETLRLTDLPAHGE